LAYRSLEAIWLCPKKSRIVTTSAPCSSQFEAKGLPQALTTRGDPGGLGVALPLLVARFDREGLVVACAVPQDIACGPFARTLRQTGVETGHQSRGHRHAPILATFPLLDP
jgi:hypothetical protein